MSEQIPVLQLRQINKNFPGVKALQQAQLSLYAGEVHALLGENGAGKSTLVKVMTGVLQKDSGELLLDSTALSFATPKDAQQAGISTVYQEVNLLPNLSVAHNLFLGSEPKRFGFIDKKAMANQARHLLSTFGLDINVTAPLSEFSVAVQQLVAIARGIAPKRGAACTKVLVLDEPTASLDADEVQVLFQVLRQLKQQGVAIVFITHFLDQVYQISDRITVMRNGCFVGEYQTAHLNKAELIAAMLGKELIQQRHQAPCLAVEHSEAILTAHQLSSGQSVQQLDLDLPLGQAVGLAGLLGSGRTEICRLLFGLAQVDSGTLSFAGSPIKLSNPAQAIALGIALCPEDRKSQGMIAPLSIRENISLALQAKQGWWRVISKKKQQQLADFYIEKLQIATPDADKAIGQLSGGNQQKVILARWLAVEPKLLLLDEPTRGIDIGAHAEILQLIRQLCQQGMSLLVTSSELEELTAFSSKIVVMRDRKKVAELSGEDLNPDRIMAAIAGAQRMTNGGVVVDQTNPEQLKADQLKTARQARYSPGQSAHKFSLYLYPLVALALLLLVNVLLDPQFFSLQWQDGRLYGSLIDIVNRSAPVALLAIGMSLVIATGGIDLSVGAVMAICGAVCANLLVLGDWSIPAVIGLAVLTGLACGLVNGVMVSYLGIQPIVATLVLMVAGRGVAQLLNQGQIVTFQNPDFAALGSGSFIGLPVPVWLVLLALLIMQLLLRRTALGLFIEAVGCNAKASRYLGIDDRGIKLTVYLLAGGCAALAGIIATADIQGSDANNAGLWLELDAILAVVIGGAALTGGRFSLPRAVIGVLIIQALSTTIVVSGLPSKFNLLIKALVILLVLMLQSELFRHQLKSLFSFGKSRGGKA